MSVFLLPIKSVKLLANDIYVYEMIFVRNTFWLYQIFILNSNKAGKLLNFLFIKIIIIRFNFQIFYNL